MMREYLQVWKEMGVGLLGAVAFALFVALPPFIPAVVVLLITGDTTAFGIVWIGVGVLGWMPLAITIIAHAYK